MSGAPGWAGLAAPAGVPGSLGAGWVLRAAECPVGADEHPSTGTQHPLLSPVLPVAAKKGLGSLDGICCSHGRCGWHSRLVAATGAPARPTGCRDHGMLLASAPDTQGRCPLPSPRGWHGPAAALVPRALMHVPGGQGGPRLPGHGLGSAWT